jgi:hypothetical protein
MVPGDDPAINEPTTAVRFEEFACAMQPQRIIAVRRAFGSIRSRSKGIAPSAFGDKRQESHLEQVCMRYLLNDSYRAPTTQPWFINTVNGSLILSFDSSLSQHNAVRHGTIKT